MGDLMKVADHQRLFAPASKRQSFCHIIRRGTITPPVIEGYRTDADAIAINRWTLSSQSNHRTFLLYTSQAVL